MDIHEWEKESSRPGLKISETIPHYDFRSNSSTRGRHRMVAGTASN